MELGRKIFDCFYDECGVQPTHDFMAGIFSNLTLSILTRDEIIKGFRGRVEQVFPPDNQIFTLMQVVQTPSYVLRVRGPAAYFVILFEKKVCRYVVISSGSPYITLYNIRK